MNTNDKQSLNPFGEGQGKYKASQFNSADYNLNKISLEQLNQVIDAAMVRPREGFPLKIFPEAIQTLINEAEKTKGFNKDFFSAAILSACATSIGKTVSLSNGSYTARSILWMAIIGSRGTGKTHPLEWALGPIVEKDSQTFAQYKNKMQEWDSLDKDTRGNKPKCSKYILGDFTPEKLAETLNDSIKGVLVFQDELMQWLNSFDKYKKGADQQMYLSLFNGNAIVIDRVTKEPMRIEEPNVNILGGMQPEILKSLAGSNRSEDGFMDRFLFVYPENLTPHLFTGHDIPDDQREDYHKLINNLLDAPSRRIEVSKSNVNAYKLWQHSKAKECFNDDLERAIQAKMETYVWRFALIIEMIQQASEGSFNNELQDESLKKAIDLVEYFRTNALKVHDRVNSKDPTENLSLIQKELYNELPQEFKRANVMILFEEKKISGGSMGRFLNREKLFTRISHGHYKKCY